MSFCSNWRFCNCRLALLLIQGAAAQQDVVEGCTAVFGTSACEPSSSLLQQRAVRSFGRSSAPLAVVTAASSTENSSVYPWEDAVPGTQFLQGLPSWSPSALIRGRNSSRRTRRDTFNQGSDDKLVRVARRPRKGNRALLLSVVGTTSVGAELLFPVLLLGVLALGFGLACVVTTHKIIGTSTTRDGMQQLRSSQESASSLDRDARAASSLLNLRPQSRHSAWGSTQATTPDTMVPNSTVWLAGPQPTRKAEPPPCLCPELVLPAGTECTLLVPRISPSCQVVSIDDPRCNPVFHASLFAKPSVPSTSLSVMAPSRGTTNGSLVLSSADHGKAVFAFCREVIAVEGKLQSLTIHSYKDELFGELKCNPGDGNRNFKIVTSTGREVRFSGTSDSARLDVMDSQGRLLAIVQPPIDKDRTERRSVVVGPLVDAGLVVLGLLGIDWLEAGQHG